MIYIFVVETVKAKRERLEGLLRAFGVSHMVKEGNDEEVFFRRGAAWCALASAYEWLTGNLGKRSVLPLVHRDLLGKPTLNTSPDSLIKTFSISYSGELVAIAFSDLEGGLGVDIEQEREIRNPEKIENRITANINEDLQFLQKDTILYYYARQREDGCLSEFMKIPEFVLDFYGDTPCYNSQREKRAGQREMKLLEKWTLTEAYLKADGGGFCRIGELSEIKRAARCRCCIFNHLGKTVYLSVAQLKC